jgi:inhibitor of KinA
MEPQFQPLGDAALRVGLGDQADAETCARVRALCKRLEGLSIAGVIEHVPACTSVTIYYQPWKIDYHQLCQRVSDVAGSGMDELPDAPALEVTIPVCYGGEFGPDLERVAQAAGLTAQQAVELHSGAEYRVQMMGFAPGFPYLSGLPERLATPRLAKPRLAVPAGSVGIGGSQTGVYPIQTPGGWNIIGQTAVKLFDPAAENPFLLSPGDIVRFKPVTREEHDR